MTDFFSWLKNNVNDSDRVSNAVATLACVGLFAGTVAALASVSENESAETTESAGAPGIVVSMADFRIAERVAEIESIPEETPPAIDVPDVTETTPEPPAPEPPPPQKISDDALREISTPPPEDVPEPEKEPEQKPDETPTPVEEEKPPEEKKEPAPQKPKLPPQQAAPADAAPLPPQTEQTPRPPTEFSPGGKRTLYGTLADAVRRKKFYPKTARRLGRTGTVFVRVEISNAGKIVAFSVKPDGNAHESLNAGALETFRRVAEKFSAPDDFRDELPAVFVVPVVYEIKD